MKLTIDHMSEVFGTRLAQLKLSPRPGGDASHFFAERIWARTGVGVRRPPSRRERVLGESGSPMPTSDRGGHGRPRPLASVRRAGTPHPHSLSQIALAEAGFACRSQSAEGFGNPRRVPIKIDRSLYWTRAIMGAGIIPMPSTKTARSTSTTPMASDGKPSLVSARSRKYMATTIRR